MSSLKSSIYVEITGKAPKEQFFYCTNGERIKMATPTMYRIFNSNFNDKNVFDKIFKEKEGIHIATCMLNKLSFPLYCDIKKTDEYLALSEEERINNYEQMLEDYNNNIKTAFDKFLIFISSIKSTQKSNKELYNKYLNIICDIPKKQKSKALEGTPLPEILKDIANSMNSSQLSTVVNFVSQINNFDSTDIAKNKIQSYISSGVSGLKLYSSLDPLISKEIREYCIKYIGEGSKMNDEYNTDNDSSKTLIMMVLYLLKKEFYFMRNEKKENIDFNINSVESINEVLIKLLEQPKLALDIVKVYNLVKNYYSQFSDTFNFINNLFSKTGKFSYSFNNGDKKTYIGGTRNNKSSIKFRNKDQKEVNKKLSSLKISAGSDSDSSDSDSSDSDSDDSDSENEFEEKIVEIEINHIKNFIRFMNLSEEFNIIEKKRKLKTVSSSKYVSKKENKKTEQSDIEKLNIKVRDAYKSIMNMTFGESTSDFIPDWWQREFLEKIRNNNSVILVGDTSGGKTKISSISNTIQIKNVIQDPEAIIVKLAPTDQLAMQEFANMIKTYEDKQHLFGIAIRKYNDIPSGVKVIIGTPTEVEKILYSVQFSDINKITPENIELKFKEALDNPVKRYIRILNIDEIQTLSPTYVQEKEIEQKMQCKSIENIIKLVQFDRDPRSQIVGLSATLSEGSVENIKRKITELTGIETVEEIFYSFDDIGLKDLSKKSSHIPIMRKQIVIPVNYNNHAISTIEEGQKIRNQVLTDDVIETISRHAMSHGRVPIGFFRESELSTIQSYRSFVNHLDSKNNECEIWQSLKIRYQNEIESIGIKSQKNDNSGNEKQKKEAIFDVKKIDNWKNIIDQNISAIMNKQTYNVTSYVDFDSLIDFHNKNSSLFLDSETIIYSPELYGLLFEFKNISQDKLGFGSSVHPYYNFGSSINTDDFFALTSKSTKDNTYLMKILVSEDANPNENTSGIIPLLIKGIKYGVGLVTSSIPVGFWLEIFRYINIKMRNSGSNPLSIIFNEYGMTMGINMNYMATCILRPELVELSVSEFKQTNGRSGRRGVIMTTDPATYTFNISNVYNMNKFEVLDFDLSSVPNGFFKNSELYDYQVKMISKYLKNESNITSKEYSTIVDVISGDSFKNIGDDTSLQVRRIQLAMYQIKEIYDKTRNLTPNADIQFLSKLYTFLQRSMFFSLNSQIS